MTRKTNLIGEMNPCWLMLKDNFIHTILINHTRCLNRYFPKFTKGRKKNKYTARILKNERKSV